MDERRTNSIENIDLQSPQNSFTFVDMTKDVAFKIKHEGHKCLKVNKHFRNNEHFQNNFFVFKPKPSEDLSEWQSHLEDEQVTNISSVEFTSQKASLEAGETTSQEWNKVELDESKTNCSFTFISSSPNNNFTANFNPHIKKRKQNPTQPNETDSIRKKRKKRRNSATGTEIVSKQTTDNIRKRTRAGSIHTSQQIFEVNNSPDRAEGSQEFIDFGELHQDQGNHLLLYSLLVQMQPESQFLLSHPNNQTKVDDLNFDEIDDLLNDFSMISESSEVAPNEEIRNENRSPLQSDDTFFYEIQDKSYPFDWDINDDDHRKEGTSTESEEINNMPLFDFQHQSELIEEHATSDIDELFESFDNLN